MSARHKQPNKIGLGFKTSVFTSGLREASGFLCLHPKFRRALLIAYLEGVFYECTRQNSTTI
jgi:hypothetical protein